MAVYMIGYDLHEGEDYEDLINAIKALAPNNWWHCLDSTWLIITSQSAIQIRDALIPHLIRPSDDDGDKLLVVIVGKEAAWTGSFPQNCKDWLRNNL